MTELTPVEFVETALDEIASIAGKIVLLVPETGTLDPSARRVNKLSKGAVARAVGSDAFEKLKTGEALTLGYPAGLAAEAVRVVKLPRRVSPLEARKAGSGIGKVKGGKAMTLLAGSHNRAAEAAYGVGLREYVFEPHKSEQKGKAEPLTVMCNKPDEASEAFSDLRAAAEGVFFTRDLVNEPSNVLTTTEFAQRLSDMRDLGLEVDVMEEPELEKLGMRALLGVGLGSGSPTKVVVMRWNGGGDEKPFAFVGKGVVFDTGGISLKPGAGMEDMTMDMGGAGVVAGVMRTLAMRKAKANVVGVVGLVENMPDGKAQRPGDVVKSMQGTTIEVINTDAEGRLVLADILWYTQEKYQPVGMINLATLTGAIIVGLGHENAGVFSNSDALSGQLLKAAGTAGE